MSILGGLSAANAFFNQNEHLEDRRYLAKQREYQQQVMDTNAAGLSDALSARNADNQLSTATSQAGLDTLPVKVKNAQIQLGLDTESLNFKKQQMPTEQANQVKASTLQTAGLDSAVKQIPHEENKRVANNATETNEIHKKALVQLAGFLGSNDKQGALAHVNAEADADALRTGTKGKKFVNIQTHEENGDRFISLVSEDGAKVNIPFAAIQHAQSEIKTGKYKFDRDNSTGQVVAMNENTGEVTEKIAGDPSRLKTGANGKVSEMQLQYEFLTNGHNGPKLSSEKATEMISKGAKKSPEERKHMYKIELVKANANALPAAKLSPEEIDRQSSQLAEIEPSKTSNTPAPFKVNPKYENLFKP